MLYTLSQKDLLTNSTNLKTDFRKFFTGRLSSLRATTPKSVATLPREIQKIKLSKRMTRLTD